MVQWFNCAFTAIQRSSLYSALGSKGKERKGKENNGKERKGKGNKGKEQKKKNGKGGKGGGTSDA
eukprot:1151724-Pelagomonas_calceolata.AAC.8